MTAQRKINKSSTLCSFHNKVNLGHFKLYKIIIESFEKGGVVGCVTSKEAYHMTSVIHAAAKLCFKLDGHP